MLTGNGYSGNSNRAKSGFFGDLGVFSQDGYAVGISTIVSPRYGRRQHAGNESGAEMNTSLVEIETLASNYDDERMQLWQEPSGIQVTQFTMNRDRWMYVSVSCQCT